LPHPAARPDEEAVSALAGTYYLGIFEQTDFTYPPLFMLVVAAGFWIVFRWVPATLSRMKVRLDWLVPSTAAQRYIARALSAVAGVISVWLLFRIARRLFDVTTALVAAAFLALAFLHVRDSHFGVTDIPMTFMVLLAFLAIVKLAGSGSRRDLVAAGILTGLAVATKYNAALLFLPATFAIATDPLRRPVATRLARIVAFGTLMTVTFLVVSPYSFLSREKFLADFTLVSRHLAEGHGPDLGRGWTYHLTTTLRYGLGLPMLTAAILGLPLMVWRERRRGVLVALFPVAYYVLIGSGRTVFARYALPLVPFLCLFAGYFVTTIAAAAANALRRPVWRIPATTAIALVVLLPSALSVIAFDRLIAKDDTRVLARRWIEARFPPGTTIKQFGASNGRPYMPYEDRYLLTDAGSPDKPPVVVVVSSPLYSPDIGAAREWLEHEYDVQFVQQVIDEDDPGHKYDRQDEFFVPLAGFHRIERPGPNLRVYVRRGVLAR
jgi:4-amino-4-deoxy-L-arabinose transferase-like glycosyltransferase